MIWVQPLPPQVLFNKEMQLYRYWLISKYDNNFFPKVSVNGCVCFESRHSKSKMLKKIIFSQKRTCQGLKFCLIQGMKFCTLVYTPGVLPLQTLDPKETIPKRYIVDPGISPLPSLAIRGPPESPLQESFPEILQLLL